MTESVTGRTDQLPRHPAPRSKVDPFAPPPGLLALRDSGGPVVRVRTWDGSTPWVVTTHDAQRRILCDTRVTADVGAPGYPQTTASMKATASGTAPSINNTDGAEHRRWQRMLTNSFTPRRMEMLRPEIQHITDDLIDRMLAGPNPADLNAAVSFPLPSLMICALLGVPYEDHDFFQKQARVTTAVNKTPEEGARAHSALLDYIGGLVRAKISAPEEDVLSDLGAKVARGDIAMDEAQRLGHILLVAGHDTSANMITLGTALLLRDPDQLARLRDNASDRTFVSGAVEELLRYLTTPHLLARRAALADIEIEGATIRRGEGIIASLPAANWDPAAFPEPAKLDLGRDASHHIAFSWGPHHCIGRQLARIELQTVFSTLARRIPTLRLAVDLSELVFKEDSQGYGIHELPVAW